MSWFDVSANETEAGKSRVCAFLAVNFDFSMGHQYYWTGVGQLSLFGNTYIGVGELGKISSHTDQVRSIAERKTYELSGAAVDISILSEADIEASFGRTITEYLGFLDPDTLQLVANPEINWEGTIGSIRRVHGPQPTVQVSADHILAIQDQADGWRYTHEHQQLFFPAAGDKGFDQTPSIMQRQVLWGGYFVFPGHTSPSGPPGTRNVNLP